MKTLTALILSLICFSSVQSQITASDTKRLAIVIGNGNYQYSPPLTNPVNDARSMRSALQGLGFEVFEYENLNQSQMKMAIDNFGTKLKDYSTGLFFYAGHGLQSKGSNYLIPVDANIHSEQQIEYDCVQADRVLGYMEAAGSKINIVILDACRNNPFERSWSRAMDGSGLAFMNAPTGSLIAYSTSPGRTASDGSGENGLYTSCLLENLKTPDITILQMFQNVRRLVSERSSKQQIPWESTSLTDDFFFVNSGKVEKPESTKMTVSWMLLDNGYFFYINNEIVSQRTTASWSDQDLLVYDPVTKTTSVIENYNASTKNVILPAKLLATNISWRSKDGFYYLYVNGEQIAARTKSVYVDNDLLVYDPDKNTTYLLKNYSVEKQNQLHPAAILDNADFAFWRKTKDAAYFLYVKGESIHDRTRGAYAGNDLIVYDTITNITYLLKDFTSDAGVLNLRTAPILSYQDNAFWNKLNGNYWLIVKGLSVHGHSTSKWIGNDLHVTDNETNITYVLADYQNASENQPRVAVISP